MIIIIIKRRRRTRLRKAACSSARLGLQHRDSRVAKAAAIAAGLGSLPCGCSAPTAPAAPAESNADAIIGERNAVDPHGLNRECDDRVLLLPVLMPDRAEVVLIPDAGRLADAEKNDMLESGRCLLRLLLVCVCVCVRAVLLPYAEEARELGALDCGGCSRILLKIWDPPS